MAKVFKIEDSPKSDFRGAGSLYRLVGEHMGAKKLGTIMIEVQPGFKGTRIHYHPEQESMFIIIQGTGTVNVIGTEHPVEPGTVCYMAPGETHGLLSTGETVFRMIEILSPPFPSKSVTVHE